MMGDAKRRTEDQMKNLIPGLPDEIAMECMVRVPYQFHSSMRCVCHSWRSLVSEPCFYRERRKSGNAERLLCLVQPLAPPPPPSQREVTEGSGDSELTKKRQRHVYGPPQYGLSLYNATWGTWNRIRLRNGDSIPLFCEFVALPGGKLLLLGGWDPATLQPVTDVYVVELSGNRLVSTRRGAQMSVARSFFACGAVGDTKVYVAGGHDDQKNALRSAEVYDVEKDEWETIPPMEDGRDECHGVSIGNLGFCVISGYGTDNQGEFRSDAEIYDPVNRRWSRIENIWPFSDTSPRGRTSSVASAVSGGEDKFLLWCLLSGEQQIQQRELEDAERKVKLVINPVRLPNEASSLSGSSYFAASLGSDRAVVIGGKGTTCGGECGNGEGGVMMMRDCTSDDKNVKWSHIPTPSEFSGLPFSSSSILI